LLRLTVAPASTLAGFRAWGVDECPVAPGRRASPAPRAGRAGAARSRPKAIPPGTRSPQPGGRGRQGTKTARFLALAEERHGPLGAFPLAGVSRVSAELAPEAGLHPGAARAALRRHVLARQNGSPR